ncbi:hypothetical protein BU26DRAFT_225616 [Trematosphaeria pertusa]|uniref:Uncharacterized protein n=1 Tax=Trematosphaeria pertusa TaxID=390896 RepID=A0A6A6ISQ9_9PLEO|nr:uncharacterized protein BU26DRAFT_225616 [Trematosphaeria pertusa]KAF2253585.1 hypothetical protein BU26DRAFT_225616 [Trematosphaeria pertusa]
MPRSRAAIGIIILRGHSNPQRTSSNESTQTQSLFSSPVSLKLTNSFRTILPASRQQIVRLGLVVLMYICRAVNQTPTVANETISKHHLQAYPDHTPRDQASKAEDSY